MRGGTCFCFWFVVVVTSSTNYSLPSLPRSLRYTEYELKYASHHLYVNLEHKLVYCAIPKVACTEFSRLFFRLKGQNRDRGAWLSNPHFRRDKPLLKDLGVDEATRIMNDPSFFKFVFFRDPVERLLSAWVDKFVKGEMYRGTYAVKFYHRPNLTFSEFVDVVAAPPSKKRSDYAGLGPYSNAHWRPQRFMCSLDKFLPLYNFVGSFGQLQRHAEDLLRATGLWDDYGAWGWSGDRRFSSALKKKNPGKPGGPIFSRNMAAHRARDTDRKDDYLTDDLKKTLRRAYWQDYEMLDNLQWNHRVGPPVSGRPWFYKNHTNALCHIERRFCHHDDQGSAGQKNTTTKRPRPPPRTRMRKPLRSGAASE
mmetsp:Transcript_29931/g.96579  ORF Transcript_29931/g.96579 Transcript_29931/m.96579 type:complete len:365 (-) Transcript_29931:41-1135(-)